MATINSNTEIIVTFHTGRGGSINNAGYRSFYGEMNLQELISEQSNYLYSQNRDRNGRFCKPYYVDASGHEVVSAKDFDSLTGYIEFDGPYDTYEAMYLRDCNEEELELIRESDRYKSDDLEEYTKEEEF